MAFLISPTSKLAKIYEELSGKPMALPESTTPAVSNTVATTQPAPNPYAPAGTPPISAPSMGFELSKLMQQYGVGTPSMAPYTGTNANTAEIYGGYQKAYQDRLAGTNMYNQGQFSPTKTATPQWSGAVTAPNYEAEFNKRIETAYKDLLNRDAASDPGGRQHWLNQLSAGNVGLNKLDSAMAANLIGNDINYYKNTYLPNQITDIYSKYFNRPPEESGLSYWQNFAAGQNLAGKDLTKTIVGSAQGSDLENFQKNFPGGLPFAKGGRVRTHYQTGGETVVPPGEDPLADLDKFYQNPQNFSRPRPVRPPTSYRALQRAAEMDANLVPPSVDGVPVELMRLKGEPMPGVGEGGTIPSPAIMPPQVGEGGTAQPLVPPEYAPIPSAAAAGENAPAAGQASPLEGMLARYLSPSGSGSQELAEARRRSQAESEAFYNMIRQMSERGESPTSRAEMYFRLASAFGAPTKTGAFGETLSNVGRELTEYTKGRRADESERRGLMMKAQEARMAGAREDLATTRALAAQEASERRVIASKLLEEYIKSGQPQSNAGRMARDAGLRPGTPEFQDFVRRNSELDIERTRQLIEAQNENIRLRSEASERLSPTEIRMADETMQSANTARDNLSTLRRALELNERSVPSNLTEGTITSLRRRLGSTAPEVVNTAELQNMLSSLTLSSLKATFPGSISNDERLALDRVSGVTAMSREERRRILQNAIDNLERIVPRYDAKISEIRSGAFGRQQR